MRHHEETLDAYVQRVHDDPSAIAVIVVGSVARGTERPDSDVDVYLIVTDDAFEAALVANRLIFADRSVATYPGGSVDVKLATVDFLDAAAERGDDPVRASFEDALLAWVRPGHDLADRIAAIPVLPDEVWERRAVSFMAQVWWHGTDYLPLAVEEDNTFLLRHAAVQTVLAGGRALLALNRKLYRGARYLDDDVATVDRLPDGYHEIARRLITEPTRDNADAYVRTLESFHPWPIDRAESASTFVRENELSWLTRVPPPEFR